MAQRLPVLPCAHITHSALLMRHLVCIGLSHTQKHNSMVLLLGCHSVSVERNTFLALSNLSLIFASTFNLVVLSGRVLFSSQEDFGWSPLFFAGHRSQTTGHSSLFYQHKKYPKHA